jgi:hypothetical protein
MCCHLLAGVFNKSVCNEHNYDDLEPLSVIPPDGILVLSQDPPTHNGMPSSLPMLVLRTPQQTNQPKCTGTQPTLTKLKQSDQILSLTGRQIHLTMKSWLWAHLCASTTCTANHKWHFTSRWWKIWSYSCWIMCTSWGRSEWRRSSGDKFALWSWKFPYFIKVHCFLMP